jgi:hypothetical protein
MSAKWKPDFRTILYIVIVVLVIIAVIYVVLGPKEESEKVLSPNQVLTNKNLYVNKNIIVEGIYYSQYGSVGVPITDVDLEPTRYLLTLDLETNNITDAVDANKFRFYGKLEWATDSQIPNTDVILIVDKIEKV